MTYVCPECNYESEDLGTCPDCGAALVEEEVETGSEKTEGTESSQSFEDKDEEW